jgi:hypothetical protein
LEVEVADSLNNRKSFSGDKKTTLKIARNPKIEKSRSENLKIQNEEFIDFSNCAAHLPGCKCPIR